MPMMLSHSLNRKNNKNMQSSSFLRCAGIFLVFLLAQVSLLTSWRSTSGQQTIVENRPALTPANNAQSPSLTTPDRQRCGPSGEVATNRREILKLLLPREFWQSTDSPVPRERAVRFFPDAKDDVGSEMGHFLLPGVRYSSILYRVSNNPELGLELTQNRPSSWVIEAGELGGSEKACEIVTNEARRAIEEQAETTPGGAKNATVPGWNIHWMDFDDSEHIVPCRSLVEVVPRQNVYYHKRSIIEGRAVDSETGEISSWGHPKTYPETTFYSARPARHFPNAVRPDMIRLVAEVVESKSSRDTAVTQVKQLDIDECGEGDLSTWGERKIDAAHFWDDDKEDENGQFRNACNNAMRELHDERKLKVRARAMGTLGEAGRQSAQRKYVEALLDSKIVVLCQRDAHEDHYRLLEALISGCLVVTDLMLSLPKGLQDGQSLVFFSNVAEMKEKIRFYLREENANTRREIAREGRRVAMEQHVPWRRMENVILQADRPLPIAL